MSFTAYPGPPVKLEPDTIPATPTVSNTNKNASRVLVRNLKLLLKVFLTRWCFPYHRWTTAYVFLVLFVFDFQWRFVNKNTSPWRILPNEIPYYRTENALVINLSCNLLRFALTWGVFLLTPSKDQFDNITGEVRLSVRLIKKTTLSH